MHHRIDNYVRFIFHAGTMPGLALNSKYYKICKKNYECGSKQIFILSFLVLDCFSLYQCVKDEVTR